MEQLRLDLREPSPDDYRRASMKEKPKHELTGEIKTSSLDPEEIEKLYKRADDIGEKEEDEKEFFKREKSVKPPRKGEILKESFPPPIKLEKPEELLKEEEEIRKELKIIRYMPEGEDFDTVSQVLVTFNQPMVPLTGVDDLKKYPVPVQMIPEVEGEWRWVGTKTVKWKPTHRLPKSTEFEVKIEQGVKSEWGCEFKETFSWKFSTIPVKITRITPDPSKRVGKDAPVIIEFNQKINQDDIMKLLRVSNVDGSLIPMPLEELKKYIDSGDMKKKRPGLYHSYNYRINGVLPDQWVCFRSEKPLRLNTTFTATLPTGSPSKEGPRLTPSDQNITFSTYGPFRKTTHHPTSDIVPNQSWSINFTNNIELDDFDPERDIKIDPPLPMALITPNGASITIRGQSKGNTHYMVTCNKSMTDVYGQNLEEQTVMFSVGRARQNMYGFFNNRMIVHDMHMSKEPEFEVVSINLAKVRVCVYQVEPWEYHKCFCGPDYHYFRSKFGYKNPLSIDQRVNCGTRVFDEVIDVDNKPDELVVTKIPLTKHLQNVQQRCGQLVVYVEPDEKSWTKNKFAHSPRILTWIQVTHMASDAVSSCGGELYGFASQLSDGRAIPDVNFTILPQLSSSDGTKDREYYKKKYGQKMLSKIGGEDGSVFVSGYTGYNNLFIAEKENDTCFVPSITYYNRPGSRMLAYIINDRNLYKPNETVSIKGIYRHLVQKTWDRELTIPKEGSEVKWTFYDPRGSKLKEGTSKLNKFGSFFIEIELPDNVNLGDARVRFEMNNSYNDHIFKIQEFRTPEFKSKAKVDPGPYFPGGVAIIEGKAEYFSGGGLSGCDVTWDVNQSQTTFYPPNFTFKGFNFNCSYEPLVKKEPPPPPAKIIKTSSKPVPSSDKLVKARMEIERLMSRGDFGENIGMLEQMGGIEGLLSKLAEAEGAIGSAAAAEEEEEEEEPGKMRGKTDGSGDHKICVEFNSNDYVDIKKPTVVSCSLSIQDINRQTMTSNTSFTVHPSKYYVGIKKKKYFARKGDVLPLDLVVSDIDGNVIPNIDIEMTIYNRYWERKGYNWKEMEAEVGKGNFNSKKEPIPVDLKMEHGGTYLFVCKVVDEEGLENYTSTSVWVAGGKEKKGGNRVEQETARLIGNQTEFKPGEEAKILVSSPFSPAEGLMVVCCNGIVEKQSFRIEEDSCVLSVPIRKEYIPGVVVQVYLNGTNHRIDTNTGRPSAAAPLRPAFAMGSLHISIPPKKFTLDVNVEPDRKIMKPGEEGEVSVSITAPEDETFSAGDNETAVSLIIVDEAVLSLTGYNIPHPISNFTPGHSTYNINCRFFRSQVVMKDWNSIVVEAPPIIRPTGCYGCCFGGAPPPQSARCCHQQQFQQQCCMECNDCMCEGCCLEDEEEYDEDCAGDLDICCDCKKEKDGKDEGGAGEAEEAVAIEVRTDFRPLVVFVSDAVTNSDGKVVIPFKLPDNLTRYRVWVLCHHLKHTQSFGLGESSIQAQLPVAIRPSLPRFLNYGDEADFTVVVQNQTLDTVQVKVAVRMTNLRMTDNSGMGVLVEIPYAQRAELRFPVRTHKCGTGRFQVIGAVVGTKFADAVEKDLPIFTPSTSEAFAAYGEMDGDSCHIQSVIAPESVYNQFGGLTITTSSTALQALTDAFLYLYRYEFDCVEQISSRMLSINALQKFLYEFNVPKMPTKREIKNVMNSGFKKIKGTQRNDGAFGFWSLSSDVNIYLSLYVAHNLIRCKEAGYEVDSTILNRSKSFCQNVDRYINQYCEWYGEYTKASLRAFAVYVLTIYGVHKELSGHEMDLLSKRAESLYKEKKKYFSHEGQVWLMFCLSICSREKVSHPIVKEVLKFINQNVNETPETANFITSYGDDGKLVMLHSNRRTDGVILEVLCHVDKENYLIPKIVKGLLAHRKKGRWNSTQENVYILMALKKYFEVFESVVPDFLCRVWLGEDYGGEVKFKGREVDYKAIEIPMNVLVPDEDKIEKKDLVLWKQGQGRLYYRLGMDYAPKSHDLKPIDYGFVVERSYEAVTKDSHVKKLENGVWQFKAGELIRVKLRLTNVSRRYHVALVDSIPAGCEVLNPELKGTDSVPPSSQRGRVRGRNRNRSPYGWQPYYCWRSWYEHVNLRDERVEAFSSYLYCGVHEYEYVMRATCLGSFVVPPAKAEEMYSPELFGRSASEKVVIRD